MTTDLTRDRTDRARLDAMLASLGDTEAKSPAHRANRRKPSPSLLARRDAAMTALLAARDGTE